MKAVILAGGMGTRISEETQLRPKPMVMIGSHPVLWHVMKIYSHYGVRDFVICLGYKGFAIKEYFANYFIHTSDVTFHLAENRIEVHHRKAEPWRVTLVDTGEETQTGGRLKRVRPYVEDDTFFFTYGDGVGNIDIQATLELHKAEGKLATVTAVRPPGRFGMITMEGRGITGFREKPPGDGTRISGGFFVLSSQVFDYIAGDETSFEREALEQLAGEGQLSAYLHDGFWQPMDHLRDKMMLEELWKTGAAPWKIWA